MSTKTTFIKTLNRNGVKFKEIQTGSGLALELQSKNNGNTVYAFVDGSDCDLEIHGKNPIDLNKMQDVQTFISSRLQFKNHEIRWDINHLGVYRVESTLPGLIVGSFEMLNIKLALLHIAMDSQSPFVEAIATGAKSVDQVIADYDLYAVKVIS